MAKLPDLPNELLTVIFREFLSKTLVDHQYLCKWVVEDDAVSRRANLYRLALACRRLAKVALPLLYEQMFGYKDITTLAVSGACPDIIFSHLAHTNYLSIKLRSVKNKDSAIMAQLPAYLCHCNWLQHLELRLDVLSLESDQFLRQLVNLPICQSLSSLTLSSAYSNEFYDSSTVLESISMLRNLAGLCFGMSYGTDSAQPPWPTRSLQHLKALHIERIKTSADLAALVALAVPANIQTLCITSENDRAVKNAIVRTIGVRQWISVTRLHFYIHDDSALRLLSQHLCSFPALRHLWLEFGCSIWFKTSFLGLPTGLETFEARNLAMSELVDILDLVKDGQWLKPGLQKIRVDTTNLLRHRWDASVFSQNRILGAAREAILASLAMGVRLEPEDLVPHLQELNARDDDEE